MELYVGIDLHSRFCWIHVMDETGRKLFDKKLSNSLDLILLALADFKDRVCGVVVESTFNWYWLVDGLMENGYPVHLANPSAIKRYEGLKHVDDRRDARWLAEMLRLQVLPEGYIYAKADRPVRDLLRLRGFFVRKRTSLITSFQSMISRNLGGHMSGAEIKRLGRLDAAELFPHEHLNLAAVYLVHLIQGLSLVISDLEKEVLNTAKLQPEFELLQTLPGVGRILALTIMYEVGDIRRFQSVGNYSSYCRCVAANHFSAGKRKGKGNRKNGNRHLAWAYAEAAHFANRRYSEVQRFYRRKAAQTNHVVAHNALGHKLARASYYIMRDHVPYNAQKLFG